MSTIPESIVAVSLFDKLQTALERIAKIERIADDLQALCDKQALMLGARDAQRATASEPSQAMARTTACRLTELKTGSIMENGYKLTGYVLCNDAGKRAIVELSVVRWIDGEQMQALMHGTKWTPAEPPVAPAAPAAPASTCTRVELTDAQRKSLCVTNDVHIPCAQPAPQASDARMLTDDELDDCDRASWVNAAVAIQRAFSAVNGLTIKGAKP